MNIRRTVPSFFAIVFALSAHALPAHAQSSDATDIVTLQAQISLLLNQVADLQQQVVDLSDTDALGTTPQYASFNLTRSLFRGVSGDDVRSLQEFLAVDSHVYPENLITGYYGVLTEQAVRRFQTKHGIEPVGIAGPKTRARILALLAGDSDTAGTISDDLRERYRSFGFTRMSRLSSEPLDASLSGLPKPPSLETPGSSVNTPPVTSQVRAEKTSDVLGTEIRWLTDKPSTGMVWFDTSSPVTRGAPSTGVGHTEFLTDHMLVLPPLLPNTVYYYLIQSMDAGGNVSITGESSFTTAQ